MKLNARQDIEAPISDVFDVLTDFARWERGALRRGAVVQRTDRLSAPGVGLSWLVEFVYRGTPRKLQLEVTRHDPDTGLAMAMDAGVVAGTAVFDLVAMSPRRTRLQLKAEVVPKSILGRVLMQTLRLGRGQIEDRLGQRLADLASLCAERARRAPGA